MSRALELARQAALEGEVPVGAVVVLGGRIIGEGRNRREKSRNALSHAELEAIDAACKTLNGWRLWQCDLYVTLEPCPMCAGAIINARLRRVIYGTADPKAGSFGSVLAFNSLPYNHKPELVSGVLQEECADVLSDFFATLRARRKAESATKTESLKKNPEEPLGASVPCFAAYAVGSRPARCSVLHLSAYFMDSS